MKRCLLYLFPTFKKKKVCLDLYVGNVIQARNLFHLLSYK